MGVVTTLGFKISPYVINKDKLKHVATSPGFP